MTSKLFQNLPNQLTIYLEIQGCPNRKQKKENIYVAVEKQQRKGMTDRKWRADEETGRSYTRTQNWDTSTY